MPNEKTFEQLIQQGAEHLNANLNEEALNLLEKAIAMQPNVADLHYGKAIALARLGYTGEAIETLHELLISNPQFSAAKQLLNKLQTQTDLSVPLLEGMFNEMYFEISGRCNALCHWCYTGIANKNKQPKGNFVDFNKFVSSINYMLVHGIITPHTIVFLYNWGEPFLHPQFREIIAFLNEKKVKYGLSTNASKPIYFEENGDLSGLVHLRFSMCGFSQASYSRIYGFNFEKIRQNIESITNNFRSCGFGGGEISFHIYQFNMNEVIDAMNFAAQNNLRFDALYAFINDFERAKKYLKNELSYAELKKASEDLILYHYQERIANVPEGYLCPQYKLITIDQDCKIITCCGDNTSV